MDFGMVGFVAITVLCYLFGEIAKCLVDNKWIPIVCGASGLILGIVAFLLGIPDFPAQDLLTAAAVGVVSGLAATGVNQIGKQLSE